MKVIFILLSLIFVFFIDHNTGFSAENLQLRPAKPVLKPAVSQIKKPENTGVSLSDYIKYYDGSYSNTFSSVLAGLTAANARIISFDTQKGIVFAGLSNKKMLFIVVSSIKENKTAVKITPAD